MLPLWAGRGPGPSQLLLPAPARAGCSSGSGFSPEGASPSSHARGWAATSAIACFCLARQSRDFIQWSENEKKTRHLRVASRHRRMWGNACTVVDVEVVTEPGAKAAEAEEVIAAVLELVQKDGVPVRSQVMEYKADPVRSPLQHCGVEALKAGGQQAVSVLRTGLKARGADIYSADVGAAILCLMLGGLDEAHNLVTPLTETRPTTFGGPPKLATEVQKEAAYCHAIVHRMEGENLGENGAGFKDSIYWIGQAFSKGTSPHAIFPQLRAAADDLVGNCSDGKAALRNMGPKWQPSIFNKLCEDALLMEDPETLTFCKAVQARELQLLFDYVIPAR
eukprot:TRINITY_DN4136_c0_g1_i1.p1 TRINITY_DN4136_c0_g1~~TRINITY_DN4136_c0_g1_i1.p1  ORF type:complete len:345 (-),score=64.34 TRINITY_DN4136_c0_g1_i1:43-1050(-)